MGQTMAEKLLSQHNLAGAPVKAGDILEARIDGAMCQYHFYDPVDQLAKQADFPEGLPRVWDPDRIFILMDHHQPALSQAQADENQLIAVGFYSSPGNAIWRRRRGSEVAHSILITSAFCDVIILSAQVAGLPPFFLQI